MAKYQLPEITEPAIKGLNSQINYWRTIKRSNASIEMIVKANPNLKILKHIKNCVLACDSFGLDVSKGYKAE